MSILWPRLPTSTGQVILDELSSRPTMPQAAGEMDHPANFYAAVGGQRADRERIRRVRHLIVEEANAAGFPAKAAVDQIRFDRALAPRLLDAMGIVPAEAANRNVWTNLSLVIAPDITAWRFGFDNHERWIASDLTRHMFSRLWWQAYLLSDGTAKGNELLTKLSESDLNQLLERTTLGGMRPVVRALARAVVDGPDDVNRRDLIREAALRLRRRMVFIDHMALSRPQLDAEVGGVVLQAAESLRSHS